MIYVYIAGVLICVCHNPYVVAGTPCKNIGKGMCHQHTTNVNINHVLNQILLCLLSFSYTPYMALVIIHRIFIYLSPFILCTFSVSVNAVWSARGSAEIHKIF